MNNKLLNGGMSGGSTKPKPRGSFGSPKIPSKEMVPSSSSSSNTISPIKQGNADCMFDIHARVQSGGNSHGVKVLTFRSNTVENANLWMEEICKGIGFLELLSAKGGGYVSVISEAGILQREELRIKHQLAMQMGGGSAHNLLSKESLISSLNQPLKVGNKSRVNILPGNSGRGGRGRGRGFGGGGVSSSKSKAKSMSSIDINSEMSQSNFLSIEALKQIINGSNDNTKDNNNDNDHIVKNNVSRDIVNNGNNNINGRSSSRGDGSGTGDVGSGGRGLGGGNSVYKPATRISYQDDHFIKSNNNNNNNGNGNDFLDIETLKEIINSSKMNLSLLDDDDKIDRMVENTSSKLSVSIDKEYNNNDSDTLPLPHLRDEGYDESRSAIRAMRVSKPLSISVALAGRGKGWTGRGRGS